MATHLRILTLNIGLSNSFAGLSTLLAANQADVILLQEFRGSKEQLYTVIGNLGFDCEINVETESSSVPGTAVAWKRSLPVEVVSSLVPCRLQVIRIASYVVLNVYATSGSNKKAERNIFFGQEVFKSLTLFSNSQYILAGDFNCVLSPFDIEKGFGFNQKFSVALKDIVNSFKLLDAFRVHNPRVEEYTFFRPGKSASRLDRSLLCVKVSKGPSYISSCLPF